MFNSPLFGKYGSRIGAKTCFNVGAVMQGISGFLFAFLPWCNTVGWFIGLSYLLRFLEGMGTAMAWSAALGILMKIFPNKVSRLLPFPIANSTTDSYFPNKTSNKILNLFVF